MGALSGTVVLPVAAGDLRRRTRALHASARPLVALATQLRRAVLEAPDGMKRALGAAVDRFERELAAAGWDERSIVAASYVLCVWVDEVVAETPWGAGGQTLLERFHGEREGGARVMRLLSRLAEQPQENQALLELFHACLSLGLHGDLQQAPDAAQQLEQLRTRLFLTLPSEGDGALAPPWRAAVSPSRPAWQRRAWLAALVALGLISLGAYTTAHLSLAARVDEVFESMQQLAGRGAEPTPATPMPAAAPRLAPALADDVAARRLLVRDEANRSVLSVPADQLFGDGGMQLSSGGAALLGRVGAALAKQPGKVVVIGHTDGRDARTARLPSAWHQSFEWARGAADGLGRALPAERIAAEGAADLDDGSGGTLPRRRVDIVLYP